MAIFFGVVTDEAGNPLAEAAVFVVHSTASVRDVAAVTNAKGAYRLTSIPPGTYELSATHEAHVAVRTIVQISTQPIEVNFKLRKRE